MILTIDAGNTNIAVGLMHERDLLHHWRLSSRTQRTSDEVLLHLRELFAFDSVDRSRITSAVISSVVPNLTHAIREGVARLLGLEPVIVSASIELPVSICTDDPSEIGSDLLANAVAGYTIARGSAIVVDFGTALSFTAVDAGGCVRGVAIAPGVNTGVRGLVSHTAALPMIDLELPDTFIGTNTNASLRSGIVNGYAGLVDAMVAGIAAELRAPGRASGRAQPDDADAGDPLVLATGGEAALIVPRCKHVSRLEPWLTLRGLYEIGQST